MLAYTYVKQGTFALMEKPRPVVQDARDAVVRVSLASICTSDLHILHGSVPRAVPGITVGHEMVGVVEEVGDAVRRVRPGDRVTVNVETFCGSCFSAGTAGSITAQTPTAAGPWAAGSTADRPSMSGYPMPIRGWTPFRTPSRTARRCLWGTFWRPATGHPRLRLLVRRTPS